MMGATPYLLIIHFYTANEFDENFPLAKNYYGIHQMVTCFKPGTEQKIVTQVCCKLVTNIVVLFVIDSCKVVITSSMFTHILLN